MTISKRFRLAGLSLMLTGGLLASGLATAKYPDKPITMYIAFAAGGTTDITGRALAQGIEKILGVPVTIENKGATELDLSGISITPASGQSTCTDILDGDNNINGAPTDPIAAGSSATFSYGVGCIAKVGDPLDLSVSIGEAVVSVSGTLK